MKTVSLAPYEYIHIKDKNENVTRVVEGPITYVPLEHEFVCHKAPQKMLSLSKREYVIVKNPVMRGADHSIIKDKYGQAKNQHGELEYRFSSAYAEPFPLHPSEVLEAKQTPLEVVSVGNALRIKALRDFNDGSQDRQAGDEWLFVGLATYYPRREEQVMSTIKSVIIKKGLALRLRTNQEFTDDCGTIRKAGEEWLVRKEGRYLPKVFEDVVGMVKPTPITESQALTLKATQSFVDFYKVSRKAGEEWLLTTAEASSHIVDIYEEMLSRPQRQILKEDNYCVILEPWDTETRTNKKGTKVIRTGKASFFLYPGESLEGGIKEIYILSEKEGVLCKATERYSQKLVSDDETGRQIIAHFLDGNKDKLCCVKNKKNGNIRVV